MLKELLKEKYETIKNENNLENKAYMIVSIFFEGKLDKGKKPYMEHLLKLRDSVDEENQKIIALLHDTIEDLKITKEELEEIGFPREITDVVQILSRNEKPKEDYNDYIERIIKSGNKDAYIVKLADLKHNMDISRIKKPTVKDFARIENRYRPNYIKIQNKLNEMRK